MWPLQSDAWAGIRKTESFYMWESKLSGKIQKEPVHFKADHRDSWYQSLESGCLAALCLVWACNLNCVCDMRQESCSSIPLYPAEVAVLNTIRALSTLPASARCQESADWSCFALGEEENYRWAWKQREERRKDWQTAVSVWDGQERETWFLSAQTIAQASKKHMCVRWKGEEKNKFNSALHFLCTVIMRKYLPIGKASSTSPLVSVSSEL